METGASVRDCYASGKSDGAGRCALNLLPRKLAVADAAVETWLLCLDINAFHQQQCAQLLSDDERERAARFHSERDRARYIAAHGLLRVLLGNSLRAPPHAIEISQSPSGKPCLADAAPATHFNLSHSGNVAVYAICRHAEPGIDIEQLDRKVDHDGLAQKFFSRREQIELERVPIARRKHAFLTCWTRKEAVVKATGDGLRVPLREVEVTVDPDTPPRLIGIPHANAADWTLHALDAGSACTATLALHRAK